MNRMIDVPTIFEMTNAGPIGYDIYSRLMTDRIIFLNGEIAEDNAQSVIAQLLYLERIAPKEDITLYINSPGGDVTAGLAIYDTMQYISCDVSTVCLGLAASMGAFLLAAGVKGKRYSLPNSDIMIHQVSSGCFGQCTDMEIATKHVLKIKENLNRLLAVSTDKDIETIKKDTERDNWMDAKEALNYGIIDGIISKRVL